MEKMIYLKPCPFCGGEAVIEPDIRYYLDDYKIIECTECGASLMSKLGSAEEAAEAWNRRAKMYKSPIDVFCNDIRMQLEDSIYRAVQDVGITVDKQELIKALNYDRDQYEKGYAAGKKDAVVHGKWLLKRELISIKGVEFKIVNEYACNKCGRVISESKGADVLDEYPYCHCGAKMDLEAHNE